MKKKYLNSLKDSIRNCAWNSTNFRHMEVDLASSVQQKLQSFKPIKREEYCNNPIQLIDFFCGAGGMSLGFAAVNRVLPVFKMLGGCDVNKVSAESYSQNFDTPLFNENIVELAYEKGRLDLALKKIGFEKNKPTVLIGCAPCQGFSSHRKKHWNDEEDVRNNLIMAFVEIVKKIKPNAIIMENVPEFLSVKYWKYYSAAHSAYQKMGYTIKGAIFNAASFGVPQERFRSIIIGMKSDFALPNGLLAASDYRTVRDAISMLPRLVAGSADPNDPLHKSISHKQSTLDVIQKVAHNGGNRPAGVGPKCLDKTKGFSDVYGRLFWDKPSITITHYARNPASGRFTHPEQDRGLTAREAALLQSFPVGFHFSGKSDDIYRQIGEAVPPMLSAVMATKLVIELLSPSPTPQELNDSPTPICKPVSSSYSSVIAGIKNKGRLEV